LTDGETQTALTLAELQEKILPTKTYPFAPVTMATTLSGLAAPPLLLLLLEDMGRLPKVEC
jgi:hypothetical protein